MAGNELNGLPVKRMQLSELVKAPWNPRKISPEQAAALQRSLKEFGTVEPVVWNKRTGHIIGGHQRVDALLACGEQETDVVIVDMSEEREKQLNIALNRISGEWDNGLLSELFQAMQPEDFELTGFSEDEIAALTGGRKKEAEGEVNITPELLEEHNYVVFYFNNELDWRVIEQKLELTSMKSLKHTDKIKSGASHIGIGRVLSGKKLLLIMGVE